MNINGTGWSDFERSGEINHYIAYKRKLEEKRKKIKESENSKKDSF